MSTRHSALISGAPSGMGAARTDCFATHGSEAVATTRGGTRTATAFEPRFRLSDQVQHDTSFQGFVGASMLLNPVEQAPADSPSKPALSRALVVIRRAIDEGRKAMRGPSTVSTAPASLEEAFSKLLGEAGPGQGVQIQIFVQGKTCELTPTIEVQLFLIGREAVLNALRHSQATNIEVEIQYSRDLLCVLIRDNGCGIKPEAVQKARNSHWGLRGMRQRAENLGAQFDLWSKMGAGTEVRVAVPVNARRRANP